MGKKILIVEDDKELRRNILILLEEEGYKVFACEAAERAIDILKNNTVDLIICDIMLPGMSGYDFLKLLFSRDNFSAIPFIFLSAKAERHDLRLGMELGADDYVFKPFKADDLLKSIKTRLNRFETIKKTKGKIVSETDSKKTYSLSDRFLVDERNKAKFIQISAIKYIAAQNQYSLMVISDLERHLIRKSLNSWEASLPEKNFLRIHRSTIINLDFVSRIEKSNTNKMRIYIAGFEAPLEVSKRCLSKIKTMKK